MTMVIVGACPDGDGDGSDRDPSGRLGLAGFRWGCAGDGDLGCSVRGAFPHAVAVGSRYEVRAVPTERTPDEISIAQVQLSAAIRAGVSGSGGLQAVDAGEVTLMALGFEGELVDYTTIEQREVQRFELRDAEDEVFPPSCSDGSSCADAVWDEPPPPPEFVVGSSTRVRAEPIAASDERLMGDLHYEWDVTPEAVATLGGDRSGNQVDVQVHSTGRFEIRVTAGGISQVFSYGATSAGPRRRRSTPGDTGGETDGSGTESDTDTDGTGTDGSGTTGGDTEGLATSTGGGM